MYSIPDHMGSPDPENTELALNVLTKEGYKCFPANSMRLETMLIRSLLVNWRSANFLYLILKGHHLAKCIKQFSVASAK
jgi:hypothetical protein